MRRKFIMSCRHVNKTNRTYLGDGGWQWPSSMQRTLPRALGETGVLGRGHSLWTEWGCVDPSPSDANTPVTAKRHEYYDTIWIGSWDTFAIIQMSHLKPI